MKSFPSNFAAEKDKKRGASPVWILKCPFASGTVYLSDQAFTITGWDGGITTKSWIHSWGNIDEDIAGDMASPRVSDMLLKAINDPNDASNIEAILENASNNIETTDCELYLWFLGLDASTDPPQKMWVGNIVDWEKLDELLYDLELVDQSVRVNKYVGTKIDKTTHPNADPDDIGKVSNIVYGDNKDIPCHAILAGALNYLDSTITDTQTTLDLVDASKFPASSTIGIEDEKIAYTGKTGNQLTGLTRGVNGTSPATHQQSSAVWEERNDFAYCAADHPIKQFGEIYAKAGDKTRKITSICTLYTGKTGSQHPTWPNKAIIAVPGKITIDQAVDLLVNDGIDVDDAIDVVDTIAVDDTIDVNDDIGVNDGIGVSDTIAVIDTIDVDDQIGVSDTISVDDQITVDDNLTVGDNIVISSDDPINTWSTSSGLPFTKRLTGNGSDFQNISYGSNFFNPQINYNDSQNGFHSEYAWGVLENNLGTSGYFRVKVDGFNVGVNTIYEVVNGVVTINVGSPFILQETYNKPLSTAQLRVEAGNGWNGDITCTFSQVKLHFYEVTRQANKTGSAYRSNSVTKGGQATKIGSATKTGLASKIGSAVKQGSAAKTGSATKTGSVSKVGLAAKTGLASKSGVVTKTGTATMSGNSVANTLVADTILADIQGYEDDASGTFTGTPNALVERPDHVIKHILYTYASWAVANFYTDADTQFATKGYKFAGVINEYKKLKHWLTTLSFQCRCWFRFHAGQAQLLWRPDTMTSDKTITSPMIRMKEDFKTTVRVKRSPLYEVINKISIHYDRDWTKSGGEEAYKEISKDSDSASITRYGEKEKPELFFFDFVTDLGMADDLRDFYLARYKDRKKLVQMEIFMDNSELEFADGAALAPISNLLCEVQKVNIHPGSGKDMRNDRINLMVREY